MNKKINKYKVNKYLIQLKLLFRFTYKFQYHCTKNEVFQ